MIDKTFFAIYSTSLLSATQPTGKNLQTILRRFYRNASCSINVWL